jgi:hypothetical protein
LLTHHHFGAFAEAPKAERLGQRFQLFKWIIHCSDLNQLFTFSLSAKLIENVICAAAFNLQHGNLC